MDLLLKGRMLRRGAIAGVWCRKFIEMKEEAIDICSPDDVGVVESSILYSQMKDVQFKPRKEFEVIKEDGQRARFRGDSEQEVRKWVDCIKRMVSLMQKTWSDLKLISIIGKGFYGQIVLAERSKIRQLCAIKAIDKRFTMKERYYREYELMKILKHPFIVETQFSFETKDHFFISLEFIGGGDLFYRIQEHGRPSEHDAIIIIAEIALALEYLHNAGIIYRDLKPENILCGMDGHVKIADFGLAKDINDGSTDSFCGTLDFLAPEVVLNRPYTKAVDVWAFGILIYEILYGIPPFHNENQMKLMKNIIESEVEFPEEADNEQKELIRSLLLKDPSRRPTISDLKQFRFFCKIDWNLVLSKGYEMDFIPLNGDRYCMVNFDPLFTSESYAPLMQEINQFLISRRDDELP